MTVETESRVDLWTCDIHLCGAEERTGGHVPDGWIVLNASSVAVAPLSVAPEERRQWHICPNHGVPTMGEMLRAWASLSSSGVWPRVGAEAGSGPEQFWLSRRVVGVDIDAFSSLRRVTLDNGTILVPAERAAT